MAQPLEELIAAAAGGQLRRPAEVVAAIGATGDERAAAVLEALQEGELHARKADGAVIRVTGRGSKAEGFDPLTGAALGPVAARSTEAIKVNNALRRAIRSAISTLTLMSPDPARRMAAAGEAFRTPRPRAARGDRGGAGGGGGRRRQGGARGGAGGGAAAVRRAVWPTGWRRSGVVAGRGGSDALAALTPLQSAEEPEIAEAAKAAVAEIERSRAMWAQLQNVWFGLSLGSVLLLAAVGLAITFGVMGVINMAHGELIMLGAYTTFVIQELIRDHAPGLFDWSLLIAAPAAFLVAGGDRAWRSSGGSCASSTGGRWRRCSRPGA